MSTSPEAAAREAVVRWARDRYEDLTFGEARRWLESHPGWKAAGHLPVYAPREALVATGFLPVGITGGGDQVEIIRGDAFYQSYICHLPRSVVELAELGRFSFLSAMLFPSTCDVIRNLSGMWQVLYPGLYVRYLDLPQVADREAGARFWEGDLRTLLAELGAISGRGASEDSLRDAIREYNTVRSLIRELYTLRREEPWRVPTEELYLLMRAGEVVPAALFIARMREYLAAAREESVRVRDNSRVMIVGAFCEQPPLGLVKTIERAGCYIVEDDFLLGNRFLTADVAENGDPVANLARALAFHAPPTSVLYEPDPAGKRGLMKMRARAARADGIIFAAPSFCDPALLDQPMLRAGADADGIPSIAFKFAENSGQFQQFREQAGTFADSIKLWGE